MQEMTVESTGIFCYTKGNEIQGALDVENNSSCSCGRKIQPHGQR